MNPRLAIAIVCLAIAGYILGYWSEAFGANFVDENTPKHFVASSVIGLGTAVATQGIDNPTLRRTTALSLCMVPGVAKELMDDTVSGEDLFWDAAGCIVGLAVFDGVNLVAGRDRIALVGRF